MNVNMFDFIKKYGNLLLGALIVAMIVIISSQGHMIKNIKADRDLYKTNMNAALTECTTWKVKEGLSAAKNDILTLRISELEKYRSEDLNTINSLKTKNESLDKLIKENSETKIEIKTVVKDSLIYIKDTTKVIQKIDWSDNWSEFHAVIDDKNIEGTLTNRDSLVVGTTTEYKRFLGFLWKTNKIKNQKVYVTSKNPHTVIQDVECININN